MKKTLLILFVLFLFLSGCERAPLIEDYKIENISLGDSLNDLMSKNEIEEQIVKSKTQFDYRGDDFASIYLVEDLNTYDYLFLIVKPNDKKYIIQSIFGNIEYSNIDLCYDKQEKLAEEFSNTYNDAQMTNGTKKFEGNNYNGKFKYFYFDFDSGDRIAIQCYKYDNGDNAFTISISKKDPISWLSTWK